MALGRLGQCRVKRIRRRLHEDTDAERARGAEIERTVELQTPRREHHALLLLGRDAAAIVQHPVHGRQRRAYLPGDIARGRL